MQIVITLTHGANYRKQFGETAAKIAKSLNHIIYYLLFCFCNSCHDKPRHLFFLLRV